MDYGDPLTKFGFTLSIVVQKHTQCSIGGRSEIGIKYGRFDIETSKTELRFCNLI